MSRIPECLPIIQGHEPVIETSLDDTSGWVKLTNAKGVYIIISTYGGAGVTDLVLTVHEGATGAGTSELTTVFPIWANTDCATSDTMVRQTDAYTYTIDNALQDNQLVVFYIDGSILTAGYDWIQLGSTGGFATNYVDVLYILEGARYKQVTPPSGTTA